MITTLNIKNIGIIDNISVNFNEGFNVLTGETGAGKSLIIDSLGLIAGGRFSKEMLRTGEDHAFVEACIYIQNSEEKEYIVSREIFANGRNTCKINGRLISVTELREFMLNIIDIHGQVDNQSIMVQAKHIDYLDGFSGKELSKLLNEYSKIYEEYTKIKQDLALNYGDDKEKQRKLDLLKYQLIEIKQANLKLGEDDELEEQKKLIQNSEKIFVNLETVENELTEITGNSMRNIIKSLEKIESFNENYAQKLETLKGIYYDLEELNRDVFEDKSNIDFDEETRIELENRLDIIYSLKRKYGNNIAEILKYRDELENEINQIENLEEYIKELKEKLEICTNKLTQIGEKITEIRTINARNLEKRINTELADLEMKNASFLVDIENVGITHNGLNKIEFLIKTNIGDDFKPLSKIASGGECARIMLAIKSVLADIDQVSTMVFDEIDTGISGSAAKSVAEKMAKISEKHQIFVVTHQAIVAAYATNNFRISKKVENNKTKTIIKLLDETESISEIALILSGDVNDISIQNAKQLRNGQKRVA